MIREWIAVALGGMIGTLLRHGLNSTIRAVSPQWLPLSTLLVNIVGCFAIGWLFRWALDRQVTNSWWEVGLRVGILGGLTTFSSFALEVVSAWHVRPLVGLAIVAGHFGLGLVAVALGIGLANWMR